jgi:hypothetical protein
LSIVRELQRETPAKILDRLLRAVSDVSQPSPQVDDVTAVIIKVEGPADATERDNVLERHESDTSNGLIGAQVIHTLGKPDGLHDLEVRRSGTITTE